MLLKSFNSSCIYLIQSSNIYTYIERNSCQGPPYTATCNEHVHLEFYFTNIGTNPKPVINTLKHKQQLYTYTERRILSSWYTLVCICLHFIILHITLLCRRLTANNATSSTLSHYVYEVNPGLISLMSFVWVWLKCYWVTLKLRPDFTPIIDRLSTSIAYRNRLQCMCTILGRESDFLIAVRLTGNLGWEQLGGSSTPQTQQWLSKTLLH